MTSDYSNNLPVNLGEFGTLDDRVGDASARTFLPLQLESLGTAIREQVYGAFDMSVQVARTEATSLTRMLAGLGVVDLASAVMYFGGWAPLLGWTIGLSATFLFGLPLLFAE